MNQATATDLSSLGARPLDESVDQVKALALEFWYGGYRPSKEDLDRLTETLPSEHCRRVLCVLDLLTHYPVCDAKTASTRPQKR